MRTCLILFLSACLVGTAVDAAALDGNYQWKSEKLPDLYYEVLAASIDKAAEYQAPDGRFRSRLPENKQQDIRGFSMYGMQYIYVPALLYAADHPSNTRRGEKKLFDMAVAGGDYLASIITDNGRFVPTVEGEKVSSLDSHRSLYCWAEVYGLIGGELDGERKRVWADALTRAGGRLLDDLKPRIDRPRYTAPFIGTSPNHFGLWATTIWRIGMLLGKEDWVQTAEAVLHRFVREVAPGGYWPEHDGPMVSYDYLNVSVAGLYWHYSYDPAALRAIRLNTDFHLNWHTPDGVDIYTVDERNRSNFRPKAAWGLFAFSHFPQGRRLARLKLLAALAGRDDPRRGSEAAGSGTPPSTLDQVAYLFRGEGSDPLEALGLAALGRIAQNAHYHSDGPEAAIPQEMETYRHVLDRPAVVKKTGPWVYSMSALVSPPSPYNQFFLDRICPISLWHEKSRHIIGGGNSKGQPELATFAVKRRGADSWDYMPLDALIRGEAASDTICVAHEGYSLRLTINADGPSRALISARCEPTYGTRDSVVLNLPLRMWLDKEIKIGSAGPKILGEEEVRVVFADGGTFSHNHWRLTLPQNSAFRWPYYIYSPYGSVRVPKSVRNALGVATVPLGNDGQWVRVKVEIE